MRKERLPGLVSTNYAFQKVRVVWVSSSRSSILLCKLNKGGNFKQNLIL